MGGILLVLLTCAVVLVRAFAASSSSSSPPSSATSASSSTGGGNSIPPLPHVAPWGTMTARGGANAVVGNRRRGGRDMAGLAMSSDDDDGVEVETDDDLVFPSSDAPSGILRPLNGMEVVFPSTVASSRVPSSSSSSSSSSLLNGTRKKTILASGGFADALVSSTYVAETNLPTAYGHFRIRAYRIDADDDADDVDAAGGGASTKNPLGAGAGLGTEPCVIYCTDKPPFGNDGREGGGGARDVPVRIHDQCFTSEVFGSQR